MARTYTLKRRAEQQAETRQRIVEAAVDLHSSLGPARTTVSMIAEKAGVQRHTFYAHFPDDRSLFMACSGLAWERDPLPDARPWRTIGDASERLRVGLADLYAWYDRNAELTGLVLRDAEHHALTREVNEFWSKEPMRAIRETLSAGLNARQRILLQLALSYFTWRTLAHESGLAKNDAVDTMVRAIDAARNGQ